MNKTEFEYLIKNTFFNDYFTKENIEKFRISEEMMDENFPLFFKMVVENKPYRLNIHDVFSRLFLVFSEDKIMRLIEENFDKIIKSLFEDSSAIDFLIEKDKINYITEYFDLNPYNMIKMMTPSLIFNDKNFNAVYSNLKEGKFCFLECLSFQRLNFTVEFLEKINDLIINEDDFSQNNKNKLILNFICNEYINDDAAHVAFEKITSDLNEEDLFFSTLYYGKDKFFIPLIENSEIWDKYKLSLGKELLGHSLVRKSKIINPRGQSIYPQVSGEKHDFLMNKIFEKDWCFDNQEYNDVLSVIDVLTNIDLFIKFYKKIEQEGKKINELDFEKYIAQFNIKIISFLVDKGFNISENKNFLIFSNTINSSTLKDVCNKWLNPSQVSELIFKRINENIKTQTSSLVDLLKLSDCKYNESGINILDKTLISLPEKISLEEKRNLSASISKMIEENRVPLTQNVAHFLGLNDLKRILSCSDFTTKDNDTLIIIKEKLEKYHVIDLIPLVEKKQIEAAMVKPNNENINCEISKQKKRI